MQADLRRFIDVLGIGTEANMMSPLRLATLIEQGLPASVLDHVSNAIAPEDAGFKFRIVPRATLTRRRKQHDDRLSAEESDRLARVARIWAFATEVWGSNGAARDFLFRKHPLLEMRCPIDLVLGSDVGAGVVEDVLGRLKYGTAA